MIVILKRLMMKRPELRLVELNKRKMMTTTFDYSTFDEIRDPTLRTWNRLNVMFNMKEVFGAQSQMSLNYLKKFTNEDRMLLGRMAIEISKNGYENTRRTIIRNNNAR